MFKGKNNPKDRQALIDYQRKRLELEKQTKAKARKSILSKNLENWRTLLSDDLKKAIPQNLPKLTIEKIKKVQLKAPYDKRIVIYSDEANNAQFVTYAIAHELVRNGIATPSQIKKTSLLSGYNNINGMFASRTWKDNFLHEGNKVLIIEGASKALAYMSPRGEEQFWKEIDDFTRNKDVLVILNYIKDPEESAKNGAFIPTIASEKDFNIGLVKKSTFINLTKEEENYIETKQREIN